MPYPAASDRARDRIHALSVMCVLAIASLVIAFLGATPARVSSTELMGDERTPGDAAFIASHRGGAATAPENTLPAVTAALAARLRLRRGRRRAHRRPPPGADARQVRSTAPPTATGAWPR